MLLEFWEVLKENKETILLIYTGTVTLVSAILKWVVPILPENSRWLPIVKLLGKWVALNKNVVIRPKN